MRILLSLSLQPQFSNAQSPEEPAPLVSLCQALRAAILIDEGDDGQAAVDGDEEMSHPVGWIGAQGLEGDQEGGRDGRVKGEGEPAVA